MAWDGLSQRKQAELNGQTMVENSTTKEAFYLAGRIELRPLLPKEDLVTKIWSKNNAKRFFAL